MKAQIALAILHACFEQENIVQSGYFIEGKNLHINVPFTYSIFIYSYK